MKQEGAGMHCDAMGILSPNYDVQRHAVCALIINDSSAIAYLTKTLEE